MSRYYFLITSFPTLRFHSRPEISFAEAIDRVMLNLSSSDKNKVLQFQQYIDLLNIKAFWLGHPIDPRGSLSDKELEESLLVREGFPSFVYEFIEKYAENDERIHYFSSLLHDFFTSCKDGLLQQYFAFERELRLLFTAFRAKELDRDLSQELQFEDPTDPFVAYILAQKDMPSFDPPKEYEKVKSIYQEYKMNPFQLNDAINEYKFRWIEEREEKEVFTIDAVVSYLIKLYLIENKQMLTENLGQTIMEGMV